MRTVLRDRVGPDLRVLFVGINPGMRSAAVGHHFAGPSNRFWKLLHESALVSEPVTWRDDDRLPQPAVLREVVHQQPGDLELVDEGPLLVGRSRPIRVADDWISS